MTTLLRRNSNLFPVVPSIFNDFLLDEFNNWNPYYSEKKQLLPAVNVKESEIDFKIELAAPGLKKDDFKLAIENNVLTISSERKEEQEEKDKNGYTRKEFSFQSFSRSFNLPEKLVEAEKIEASYNEGILNIVIPKKEEQKPKPTKVIEIN